MATRTQPDPEPLTLSEYHTAEGFETGGPSWTDACRGVGQTADRRRARCRRYQCRDRRTRQTRSGWRPLPWATGHWRWRHPRRTGADFNCRIRDRPIIFQGRRVCPRRCPVHLLRIHAWRGDRLRSIAGCRPRLCGRLRRSVRMRKVCDNGTTGRRNEHSRYSPSCNRLIHKFEWRSPADNHEILGHKDPRMTLRYQHLTPAHLRSVIKALEDVTAPATTEIAPSNLDEEDGR